MGPMEIYGPIIIQFHCLISSLIKLSSAKFHHNIKLNLVGFEIFSLIKLNYTKSHYDFRKAALYVTFAKLWTDRDES